jgi:hypothetical protein
VVVVSCNQYPKNIDRKARQYLSFYKPNDTLFFKDSKSKIDTFLITNMDSDTFVSNRLGLMSPAPHKAIHIYYKQIPHNNYGTPVTSDSTKKMEDADFISLSSEAWDSLTEISLDFHQFNFNFPSDSIGDLKRDSLLIGGKLFTKYRYFELPKDHWSNDSNQVVDIYWENKYGIVAYRYQDGDYWERINLK